MTLTVIVFITFLLFNLVFLVEQLFISLKFFSLDDGFEDGDEIEEEI